MLACYVRVSSKGQKTDSQKAEITSWLQRNGIQLKSVVWYEDCESGSTLSRPAFEEMQKAIFSGDIKSVVVWKLDRISRRLKDGINLIAQWCDAGVRVVSITQQIDLSGPVGRMMASVLFGLAEIELEHRRERQSAGIKVAKERGTYQGRKKGTTKANPQRARELIQQGLKTAEIANALNVTERTIFRYLGETK